MTPAPATLPTAGHGADIDELRIAAMAEQSEGLRWQIALPAFILAALAWPAVHHAILVAWVISVVASRELRSLALARLSADTSRPVDQRLQAATRWTALVGVCRGLGALFMGQLDFSFDAVLTMILVSWGVGGVWTSAMIKPSHQAYAGFIFVPIALMWLSTVTYAGASIALLVILIYLAQLRSAGKVELGFVAAAQTQLDNELLHACLASERAELAHARDTAVQASLDKSRFLAAASHDLRQPLQALTLDSGELVRMPIPEQAKALVTEMAVCVEELRSMLDALLDVSKMDAGAVVSRPQRLRADLLARAVASGFRAAAAARGIQLTVDCPADVDVVSDPDLLRRMFANLIDNAVKFTTHGRVDVKAEIVGESIRFSVSDTGPGIAASDHELIFADMVQLEPAAGGSPNGHGLGLGIVRRAAQLLNTRIQVDSELGRGSSFSWKLPRAQAITAEHADSDAGWSLSGRHVIILDDDTMVRGAYANALSTLGVVSLLAATIEESLPIAVAADVAVVDWRLAEAQDGFAAIAQLRQIRPSLPVVMVTADTGEAISALARLHGVSLLRKPVDAQTLGRSLAVAIEAGSIERARGAINGV